MMAVPVRLPLQGYSSLIYSSYNSYGTLPRTYRPFAPVVCVNIRSLKPWLMFRQRRVIGYAGCHSRRTSADGKSTDSGFEDYNSVLDTPQCPALHDVNWKITKTKKMKNNKTEGDILILKDQGRHRNPCSERSPENRRADPSVVQSQSFWWPAVVLVAGSHFCGKQSF